MNSVCLVGRITEPEVRTTTTGKEVATFRIAVGRGDDTQWFSVAAWGKSAEFVGSYLGKGRLVAVEGRLQARKYTASDGSNREVVEIVANNVQGLDRPREDTRPGGYTPPEPGPQPPTPTVDEYDPFADDWP